MEIKASIAIPDHVYRFYADASRCIHNRTVEEVLSDALTAYAAILSSSTAQHSGSYDPSEKH